MKKWILCVCSSELTDRRSFFKSNRWKTIFCWQIYFIFQTEISFFSLLLLYRKLQSRFFWGLFHNVVDSTKTFQQLPVNSWTNPASQAPRTIPNNPTNSHFTLRMKFHCLISPGRRPFAPISAPLLVRKHNHTPKCDIVKYFDRLITTA